MPIISNQARRFSNDRARVLANQLIKTYRSAKQFQQDIVAFEAIPAVIAAQNTDVIDDGAESIGRSIVTKENAAQLKFVVEQFVNGMETDDRLQLANNWAHDTTPIF